MRKAFTLIEIVIVFAMIGILSAIVLPSLFGIKQESNLAKAQSDMSILQVALENYYLKNRHYPINENDYQTELLQESGLITAYYHDPFIRQENRYEYRQYESSAGQRYYILISPGLNRSKEFDTSVTSPYIFLEAGQYTLPLDCDDIIKTNLLQG